MWYKPVFVSIHPEVLAEFTDVARACGILQSVRGPCLIDTLLETTVQLIDNENRFETHTHTHIFGSIRYGYAKKLYCNMCKCSKHLGVHGTFYESPVLDTVTSWGGNLQSFGGPYGKWPGKVIAMEPLDVAAWKRILGKKNIERLQD